MASKINYSAIAWPRVCVKKNLILLFSTSRLQNHRKIFLRNRKATCNNMQDIWTAIFRPFFTYKPDFFPHKTVTNYFYRIGIWKQLLKRCRIIDCWPFTEPWLVFYPELCCNSHQKTRDFKNNMVLHDCQSANCEAAHPISLENIGFCNSNTSTIPT